MAGSAAVAGERLEVCRVEVRDWKEYRVGFRGRGFVTVIMDDEPWIADNVTDMEDGEVLAFAVAAVEEAF